MDPLVQDSSPCHEFECNHSCHNHVCGPSDQHHPCLAGVRTRLPPPDPVRFSQLQPVVTVDAGFASVIKAVTCIDGQPQTRAVSHVCPLPSAYLPVPPLQSLRSYHGFQATRVEDIQYVSLFIIVPRCLSGY